MNCLLLGIKRFLTMVPLLVTLVFILATTLSAAQEVIVFKLESLGAVYNHPPKKTVFSISKPTHITKIWTYHWNNGQGSMPGSIGLRNVKTGQLLGKWSAVGTRHLFNVSPGSVWPSKGDGPPWLYWAVQPLIDLQPGTYEVLDSDPMTWSTNAEMGHRGVAWVYGSSPEKQQVKGSSDRLKAFILDDDSGPDADSSSARTADKLVIAGNRPPQAPPKRYEPPPRYEPPVTPPSPPKPHPPLPSATGCSNSSAIALVFEHDQKNRLTHVNIHDSDATLLVTINGQSAQRLSAKITPTAEFASRKIGTITTSGNKIFYKNSGDAFEGTLEVRSLDNPTICRSFPFTLHVGCVQAGTLVTMANGSRKPIEQIKPGETIQAYDTKQNRLTLATVEKALVHTDLTYLLHEIKADGGESLLATGNHPVLTKTWGWKNVDQLRPGDIIYQYIPESGSVQELPLLAIIRDKSEKGVVYNLKTSRGNYFANDILVHNKCLQKGSRISTPFGKKAIETLQPGDFVIGELDGVRQPVRVTNIYNKQTVLKSLPGKRLATDLVATINHQLYTNGRLIKVADHDAPKINVLGTVYDLKTESGNYLAGDILLEAAQ